MISALELTSRNILCGSVRIVYAIIYTLFLVSCATTQFRHNSESCQLKLLISQGFGLTIGSDFYLVLDQHARRVYYQKPIPTNVTVSHGQFTPLNGTITSPVMGVLSMGSTIPYEMQHVVKGVTFSRRACRFRDRLCLPLGCFRDPSWPWYRQAVPWWTLFFLVPIYSTCSSLSNLQSYRSWQLLVMVFFSCCSYAANRAASVVLPGRIDIVSAAGALVIGSLGNLYSRVIGGTAFTSMVTGVLFLVPVSVPQS